MTSKIKVFYPWKNTPVKGVFFVPSLNYERTKQEGLNAALHNGFIAKAEFGVMDGKLGVMFTRVR